MPFSLSLGAPGIVDEAVEGRGMRDATDLRFKVLGASLRGLDSLFYL